LSIHRIAVSNTIGNHGQHLQPHQPYQENGITVQLRMSITFHFRQQPNIRLSGVGE